VYEKMLSSQAEDAHEEAAETRSPSALDLARPEGLEPPTYGSGGRRSIRTLNPASIKAFHRVNHGFLGVPFHPAHLPLGVWPPRAPGLRVSVARLFANSPTESPLTPRS
jgi:hypothetical protein